MEAVRGGPPGTVAQLVWCLVNLARAGFLHFAVAEEGRVLATAVPMSPSFTPVRLGPIGRRWVLSRFAYLHRESKLHNLGDDELVLESPTSVVRIHLHDARLSAVVAALASPQVVEDLTGLAGLAVEVVAPFVSLLVASGLLTATDEDAGKQRVSLESWEFHDLLFHARIREGRHDRPMGATFRQSGVLAPPAAVKRCMGDEIIDMEVPEGAFHCCRLTRRFP